MVYSHFAKLLDEGALLGIFERPLVDVDGEAVRFVWCDMLSLRSFRISISWLSARSSWRRVSVAHAGEKLRSSLTDMAVDASSVVSTRTRTLS